LAEFQRQAEVANRGKDAMPLASAATTRMVPMTEPRGVQHTEVNRDQDV
jgi:hypothetical protein